MWLDIAFRSRLCVSWFGGTPGGSDMQYAIQTYMLMIMLRPWSE
jgi:hypothetical protein